MTGAAEIRPKSGDLIAGRYRLHEQIGEGAAAFVFRAVDEALGRDVAVKILRGALATSPAAAARFRAEGRMPIADAAWREATKLFAGFTLDDAGTLAEIRHLHQAAGYLADPHTAVGTAAARALAAHAVRWRARLWRQQFAKRNRSVSSRTGPRAPWSLALHARWRALRGSKARDCSGG